LATLRVSAFCSFNFFIGGLTFVETHFPVIIMQCIVAHINVKPESAADWEASFAKQGQTVFDNEPGCLLYQLAKDPKKPGAYTVMEIYKDDAAVKTHMANLKKNADPAQGKMMDGRPELHLMPCAFPNFVFKGSTDKATQAIIAKIPADPDKTDDFEKATSPALPQVNDKEPGCSLYCWGKHQKEKGVYMVMELYDDMPAIQAHGKMDHFKAMGKAQKPFMASGGKLEVKMLQTVGKSHAKAPAKL